MYLKSYLNPLVKIMKHLMIMKDDVLYDEIYATAYYYTEVYLNDCNFNYSYDGDMI